MQPWGKIQLNFQDTGTKMGDKEGLIVIMRKYIGNYKI